MISIIIPLYNGQTTIKRCITSIIKQTYSDIEIIVINDGSTDDSLSVVERLAIDDTRIKIINKKNEGVSVARNTGIQNAKGEYVAFIDADDWIEPQYLEYLAESIREKDYAYTAWIVENEEFYFVDCLKNYGFNNSVNSENLVKFYLTHRDGCAPWGKLFKKVIIDEHDIMFPIGLPIAEDYIFCMQYLSYAEKIGYDDHALIHYNCYSTGENHKFRVDYPEIQFQILIELENINRLNNGKYQSELELAKLHCYCKILKYIKKIKNFRNDIEEIIEQITLKIRYECKKAFFSNFRNLSKSEIVYSILALLKMNRLILILLKY